MCWQSQTCQAVHNQPIVLTLNRHFCERWTVCNISIKHSNKVTFWLLILVDLSKVWITLPYYSQKMYNHLCLPYFASSFSRAYCHFSLFLPSSFEHSSLMNARATFIHLGSTFSDGLFSCSLLAISGVLDIDHILPGTCNPVSDNDRFLLD